ncbi:XRE family transcriptional regulator [Candidatus Gastranaerophilales bacterium]|nr:MAG: XRE family transcriptional regulator [Candidatus Gastranaerophilales bacterium]
MNYINIIQKIGKKIAYLRKNKKFSQERFSEKANISVIYLGKIERGEANPTLEKLIKITKALDVEIVEIFNFTI